MSKVLANYTDLISPDLTDAQPNASSQVSGVPASDWAGKMDAHDHAAGRGALVGITNLNTSTGWDLQGFSVNEIERLGLLEAVAGDIPNAGWGMVDNDFTIRDPNGTIQIPLVTPFRSVQYSGNVLAGDLTNGSHGFVDDEFVVRTPSGTLQVEGTTGLKSWIPELVQGGSEIVFGGGAYTEQLGTYSQIGNRVFASFSVAWTGGVTIAGPTNLRLDDLPFTFEFQTMGVASTFPWVALGSPQGLTVRGSGTTPQVGLWTNPNSGVGFGVAVGSLKGSFIAKEV